MEKHNSEKISLYKLFLTILVTGLYGMSGWFFINRSSINTTDKIIVEIAIAAFIVAIILSIYKTRIYINKLKDKD